MSEETRRNRFQDVRHPETGKLLFRFDAKSDTIQLKPPKDHPVYVDLKPYREARGEKD